MAKQIFFFFFISSLLISCSSKREVVSNNPKQIEVNKPEKASKAFVDHNVLFIVDGKELTNSNLKSIDPNTIESINVIKNKLEIRNYTYKDYDGVIVIKLKKS